MQITSDPESKFPIICLDSAVDDFRFIHSKDAYMLIYARRGHSLNLASSSSCNTPPATNGQTDSQPIPQPPSRAMEIVTTENDKFLSECSGYDKK